MAPQASIPLSANILGTIGTAFWCVQLVPQIWHNWKQKKTDGLPALMMFLWAICAPPFGVYAIVQKFNIPIQIQPHIFGTLCLISWAQILIYNHGYTALKATLLASLVWIAFGAFEIICIFALRAPYARGISWPVTFIGIIAAILLVAGLVPPYFELSKRNGRVIGINWIFLAMDSAGAFFSLMALVAQNTFDKIGGVIYILCVTMELGIFASHLIFLFRTRSLRRQARLDGKDFDDLPEASIYQCDADRRGKAKTIVLDIEVGDGCLERRMSDSTAKTSTTFPKRAYTNATLTEEVKPRRSF